MQVIVPLILCGLPCSADLAATGQRTLAVLPAISSEVAREICSRVPGCLIDDHRKFHAVGSGRQHFAIRDILQEHEYLDPIPLVRHLWTLDKTVRAVEFEPGATVDQRMAIDRLSHRWCSWRPLVKKVSWWRGFAAVEIQPSVPRGPKSKFHLGDDLVLFLPQILAKSIREGDRLTMEFTVFVDWSSDDAIRTAKIIGTWNSALDAEARLGLHCYRCRVGEQWYYGR